MDSINDIGEVGGRLRKALDYVQKHYPKMDVSPIGISSEDIFQVLFLRDTAGYEHQLRVSRRKWAVYHRVIRPDGTPLKRADAEAYMDLLK